MRTEGRPTMYKAITTVEDVQRRGEGTTQQTEEQSCGAGATSSAEHPMSEWSDLRTDRWLPQHPAAVECSLRALAPPVWHRRCSGPAGAARYRSVRTQRTAVQRKPTQSQWRGKERKGSGLNRAAACCAAVGRAGGAGDGRAAVCARLRGLACSRSAVRCTWRH